MRGPASFVFSLVIGLATTGTALTFPMQATGKSDLRHGALATRDGSVQLLTFFLLSVPPLFFLVEMVADKRAALLAISMYSLMPLTIFCGRSFTSDRRAA
jgi:hypothetical protein